MLQPAFSDCSWALFSSGVHHADILSQLHLGVAGGKLSPVSSEGPSAAAGLPGSSKPWTARPHSPSLSSTSAWASNTSKQRQMQMPTKPGLQEPYIHKRLRQLWKIQLQRPRQTHHQRQLGSGHPLAHTQTQLLHRSMSRSGKVGQANAFRQSQCIMACQSIPALWLCYTRHLLQHQWHQHSKHKCWTQLTQTY